MGLELEKEGGQGKKSTQLMKSEEQKNNSQAGSLQRRGLTTKGRWMAENRQNVIASLDE